MVILHIDRVAGNDDTGTGSKRAPWQTLARLATATITPGTTIRLKRGSVFHEQLDLAQSGTADAPIIVDAYGPGPAPLISAGYAIPRNADWQPDTEHAGAYRLEIGPSDSETFYTTQAVLVRTEPGGSEALPHHHYRLLRLAEGKLAEDSYALPSVHGKRAIVYRPHGGQHPAQFAFGLSARRHAIAITGDFVVVRNLEAMLGNNGRKPPYAPATVFATGRRVVFEDCTVRFGRSHGLTVGGAESMVRRCVAEHNRSTGLYILAGGEGSTICESTARYNGNLGTFGAKTLDRGGIGVQANDALIEGNVVHDNGTLQGSDRGGDDAIALHQCHGARVLRNLIYNSAATAIGMSHDEESYGHQIICNIIARWNLMKETSLTRRMQAIAVYAKGCAPTSGAVRVHNNTIWSDQKTATLIGILLAQPSTGDVLRNSTVFNNLVYLPTNEATNSRGIRLTRETQFSRVEIDHNNVRLGTGDRSYEGATGTFATARAFCSALGFEEHGLNDVPRFIKAVAPSHPRSFALAPRSTLIDAGRGVGLERDFLGREIPCGAAPDIGALESRR